MYITFVGKPDKEDHSEDLGVDRRIILEWILGKWEIVDWIHVDWDKDQWRALVNTVMEFLVP
jgi:hypothetical protein